LSSEDVWRILIIKDYPICRKCGKKTTGIDQSKIIVGVDPDNGKPNNGWYSEHKVCETKEIRWSKKEEK
tara:strand:+ start:635 stop:841 length:207 start_codon:yes stop_codon:yes gene_type:complete